jgi:hypothetical protein
MKRLGLIVALGLALIAAPAAAFAQGWTGHAAGGGHAIAPAPARVAPGYYHHGGAPVYRGYPPGYGRGYAPAYTHVYSSGPRVWVPGYWGWNGGVRVWIGGAWTYPPTAGYAWVAPHWAWNGYQWVWQNGYWAPPDYAY